MPTSVKYNTSMNKRSLPINTIAGMRPIYDWKTNNKSFVQVARQLELLGIRNNAFHLILLNPMLQGVDPHSDNLTPEQIVMITQECYLNLYYYLREVVRIPAQGGTTMPFRMDRGTLAASYCFINDISFYLMKPRQTGKSVGIDAMLSWAFKFGITNGDFMFVANNVDIAKKNLKIMKSILSSLPSYLANMGTEKDDENTGKRVRKTNNIKSYIEPVSGNSASVAGTAISKDAAEQIGRGFSQTHQFFDECEHTKFIDTIVKVSGMAFNTASRNALERNAHACRIFATTPGDLGSKNTCQSAMQIVNDALVWSEKFYDIGNINDLKALLAKKSNFKVIYIEYSYKQLGLGEKWFVDACSQVGNDANKIRREILLERFSGNNASPFDENDIYELKENQMTPSYTKKVGNLYEILFYDVPRKNRKYFISIDPSDGIGGDNYAITVLDPYELFVIAEFKSPYMTTDGCFDLVSYMVDKYFNNPLIIIERNKGVPLIERFLSIPKYKNKLYSTPQTNDTNGIISEKLDDMGFVEELSMKKKFYGVYTDTKSRSVMMNILMDSVRFSKSIVRSKYVVDDITKLVVKNNKIQADSGEHDDSVMSWLFALYVYYYGVELERYGFHHDALPQDVEQDDEFSKLQELYNHPDIKKHFPSMYAFYNSTIKGELEKSHNDMLNKYKHKSSILKIGGIADSISANNSEADIDREFNKISDQSNQDTLKFNLLKKWNTLNN